MSHYFFSEKYRKNERKQATPEKIKSKILFFCKV